MRVQNDLHIWMAFQTCAQPEAMTEVEEYSDRWFPSKYGSFSTFYICRGGANIGEWLALMTGLACKRKHESLTATGQTWYLQRVRLDLQDDVRGADGIDPASQPLRVERPRGGEENVELSPGYWSKDYVGLYCKATLPPDELNDETARAVDMAYPQARTQDELINMLPELLPCERTALHNIGNIEGT